MKYSLLLAVLVSMLGLTACNKAADAPAYSGPHKAEHAAAVEKCSKESFDAREKCVKKAMENVGKQ